jgi:hypothetical protein
VVTLALATRSMEYPLLPVFETSFVVFVAVFLIVFLFRQQRWFRFLLDQILDKVENIAHYIFLPFSKIKVNPFLIL